MDFSTESLIAIIVAIVAGFPGTVTAIIAIRNRRKSNKVDMVALYLALLKITYALDLILQDIFQTHEEINGDMRAKWKVANEELVALRESMKDL